MQISERRRVAGALSPRAVEAYIALCLDYPSVDHGVHGLLPRLN
jgi:hypothetical protein